jgi:hypothetical protein
VLIEPHNPPQPACKKRWVHLSMVYAAAQ